MIPNKKAQSITCSSRTEYIGTIALGNLDSPYQLPTNGGLLPNDRFMWGLRLEFRGRMTNPATGNPTGVLADAPFSLLENVRVEGTHRIRAQRERFIDARGADLRELNRDYVVSVPQVSPASLSVTASATNDISFIVDVPFVPLNVPIQLQTNYLLDAPNYDQLQLTLQFADAQSVFSGQSAQPTFSAYGSTTGNPTVDVYGIFALAGPSKFQGFVPARVWRYSQEVTSGDIVNGATRSRLFQLNKGFGIRGLLLKSGVKATTTSSGNNAYASLSNTILSNIQVMRGINRPIRYWARESALQAETQNAYGVQPSTGYGLIDFAQRGHLWEALNTAGMIAGADGDIDLFLQADIAGGSNQAALILYEEIRGRAKRV